MTGAGFLAVLVSRSFEYVEGRMIALGLAMGALFFAFQRYGPTINPQHVPVVVFLCILGPGYAVTLYGTRIMRQGGRPLKEDFVRKVESLVSFAEEIGRGPANRPTKLANATSIDAMTSSTRTEITVSREVLKVARRNHRPPFADTEYFTAPVEAQAWYELQLFRDPFQLLKWAGATWFLFPMSLFMFGHSTDDPPVVSFAFVLSLLLWTSYGSPSSDPFMRPLPLSNWTLAWVRFRLSWPALAILGPMRWLMACLLVPVLMLTFISTLHPAYSSLSGGALILLTTVWVGWITLAFGLIFGFALYLVFVFALIGELPVTQFGVVMVALYLCLLIAGQHGFKMKALFPHGAACIAASGLVLAGYFLLPLYSLSPLAHWTCREALGALLILAMLRHHSVNGVIPAEAVRQLKRVLLGGVAVLGFILLVLGPPEGPEQGITAIYLAFGVVPPLFLPFLLVPYDVRFWGRSNGE